MSTIVSALGFPRIGPRRELKTALESYWSGKTDAAALLRDAAALRVATWARQHALGVTQIPSNDFSLYDHVLDTSVMVGAIPPAYGWTGGSVPIETYFAMARGSSDPDEGCAHGQGGRDLPALEMTKWFDTNYHYMVPEFTNGQAFSLASTKPIDEFLEAKALGYQTRPVLLGPVTYLLLGKSNQAGLDPLSLLDGLLPVYAEVLKRLQNAGAEWVQVDEPALVLDLDDQKRAAFQTAYLALVKAVPGLKLLVATYFGELGDNLETAARLPVAGLHVDLVRAPEQQDAVLAAVPRDRVLSLGVVDGRNIWRADLSALLDRLEPIAGSQRAIMLAPSCSLLHTPIDLALEKDLDIEVRTWLAFAVQKLEELAILAKGLDKGRDAVTEALTASDRARASRRSSPCVHDAGVQRRLANVTPAMAQRKEDFAARRALQKPRLNLPPLPSTTIGSFPQTAEIRKARAAHAKGTLSDAEYEAFLRRETETAIRWQEEIGLDVLVHGEFERNDMVQYFGEQLTGFVFTKHAWVQSYGSRCVRPPIIYGDVSRPEPMTVKWWRFAQSLTDKPVKGMLTGPVTVLQWSFVRDDQPRSETCRQVALALREEVCDLEWAGAKIIQIDEAALREGLPLQRAEWQHYLDWAIECFRLTSSGVQPETQIHTHMCYSEFNDIIAAIGAMDADVISIETARSKMELLDAFATYAYPNEIGPGVYDIHAPRVPSTAEMVSLLMNARARLALEQLWLNPDCGLKTRKWEDVKPALVNMVEATRLARIYLG
jgi:5-methyltetrahydropteroyltriglutamate--homocysteine methyltransferase